MNSIASMLDNLSIDKKAEAIDKSSLEEAILLDL